MDRAELIAAMTAMVASTTQAPREVDIKGLGKVHIREITIGEVDLQLKDTEDKQNSYGMARGACRVLASPTGERLLDPDNPDDVALMAKLPLRVLTAINETQEAIAEGN